MYDEYVEDYLPGIKLYRHNGRFYISLDRGDEPIPSLLIDLVEEISLQDYFPKNPKRTSGIYKYKDAKAVLEDLGPNNTANRVQICGKTKDNVIELYNQIRAGKIHPTESWEVEQIPSLMSRVKKALRIFQIKSS